MARPIRYRSVSENPAVRVFETLVQRDYLEKRLIELGGKGAALLRHRVSPEEPPTEQAEFTVRQGVDRKALPTVVQKVISGDLVIERTEIWRRTAPGSYDGTFNATVPGTPAKIGGTLRLADLADIGQFGAGPGRPGSELVLDGSAHVPVPLVGGKIETVIAEQVVKLIERETRFTLSWLQK
jgi:hypothetical protein